MPVGNIGCSSGCMHALCALAQRNSNKKPAGNQPSGCDRGMRSGLPALVSANAFMLSNQAALVDLAVRSERYQFLGQPVHHLNEPLVDDLGLIRSKANSTASCPRRLLRSARKSDIPSSLAITTSPSIRNDVALTRSAASTVPVKRSAQSWPLPVRQRMREPSRRTISR